MGRKGSGSLVLMEALYHVDPPDPHHTEKKKHFVSGQIPTILAILAMF